MRQEPVKVSDGGPGRDGDLGSEVTAGGVQRRLVAHLRRQKNHPAR